jgi:hypothetical protein
MGGGGAPGVAWGGGGGAAGGGGRGPHRVAAGERVAVAVLGLQHEGDPVAQLRQLPRLGCGRARELSRTPPKLARRNF